MIFKNYDKNHWISYSRKCISLAWKEEYQEIADKIPCEDETLRMVMAVSIPSIVDDLDIVMQETGITIRDFLKSKAGETHYKHWLLSAPDFARDRLW